MMKLSNPLGALALPCAASTGGVASRPRIRSIELLIIADPVGITLFQEKTGEFLGKYRSHRFHL
jgi:hypothetical protein